MNRKYGIMIAMFACVLLCTVLNGCSNENTEENKEAIEAATKYKAIEYKVDDYRNDPFPEGIQAKADEVKPFETDAFYTKQMANRMTGLPVQIAQSTKSTIQAKDIHIEAAKEAEKGTAVLNYELVLVLTNSQGASKELKVTGELTMLNVDKEWKVNNDVNRSLKELLNLARTTG